MSVSLASKHTVPLLRSLSRELRLHYGQGRIKDRLATKYILQQFKSNVTTEKKICRGEKELHHLANTYLCYLSSNRKYQELHSEYHGKGEKTVAETAGMVGLSVPKPQDFKI